MLSIGENEGKRKEGREKEGGEKEGEEKGRMKE